MIWGLLSINFLLWFNWSLNLSGSHGLDFLICFLCLPWCRWHDVLVMYPRSNNKSKHKRAPTFHGTTSLHSKVSSDAQVRMSSWLGLVILAWISDHASWNLTQLQSNQCIMYALQSSRQDFFPPPTFDLLIFHQVCFELILWAKSTCVSIHFLCSFTVLFNQYS